MNHVFVPEHIADSFPEVTANLYRDVSGATAHADLHAEVATPVQTTPTPETGKTLSGDEAIVFGSGAAAVGLLFAAAAVYHQYRLKQSQR